MSAAGPALILRGDAACLALPDESVDLIVTSPPYWALRAYQDAGGSYDGQVGAEETPLAFLKALWSATAEWARVLKPTGSMFVNLGDKYAGSGGHNNAALEAVGNKHAKPGRAIVEGAERRNAPSSYSKATIGGAQPKSLMGLPWRYALGCVDQLGLILRAEIVWSKPNGLPESVRDRVRRSHEQFFHLTKQGSYYESMDALREPHVGDDKPRALGTSNQTQRHLDATDNTGWKDHVVERNPLGKIPGSVWTVPTEPLMVPDWAKERYELTEHFAAFPTEWPRRLILGWSPEAGVVLDPFGGTGTVAMVARALGRVGVSNDLSADYCRLARWRVFQSGQGAKAVARTHDDRQGRLL